jgi:hypothetical protein
MEKKLDRYIVTYIFTKARPTYSKRNKIIFSLEDCLRPVLPERELDDNS